MSSDNIPELCYTQVISAAQTYTTEKTICGQYISLSTTIKSTSDINLAIQFSGDGNNWDFQTLYTIATGSNKIIVSTVQSKWVRFIVTNLYNIDAAFRMYTYGTPTNSSVLSQLTKIGNSNPVVDIGNLPVNFATPTTLQRYRFQSGPASLTSAAFYSLYPSLYVLKQGTNAINIIQTPSGGLGLRNQSGLDNLDDIVDTPYYCPTSTSAIRFTCCFTSTSLDSIQGPLYALVGGASNFGDRIAIGYASQNASGSITEDSWGVFLGFQGTSYFVNHNDFNQDPCNGTVSIPTIDMTVLQCFQIVLAQQNVLVYYQYQGQMNLVHYVSSVDSALPFYRDYSIGFFMRTCVINSTANAARLASYCTDWELQSIGNSAVTPYPINSRKPAYTTKKTSVSTENAVVSIQNYSVYGSQSSQRTASISNICLTRNTAATPVTFRIYLTANISGASFATFSSYSNVRIDTSGSLSAPGFLLQAVTLGPAESTIILPSQFDFKSDDVITITAEAASGVDVAVSFNVY